MSIVVAFFTAKQYLSLGGSDEEAVLTLVALTNPWIRVVISKINVYSFPRFSPSKNFLLNGSYIITKIFYC